MNGSPSSTDYNDSQREMLTDLATIVETVNDGILPVLNTLLAAAATGLYGDNLQASSDNTNPLFYSSSAGRALTVAEVFTSLNTAVATLGTSVTNMQARITQLSTQLATTNQTDVLATLQTLSDQYRQLALQVNTLLAA